LASPDEPMLRPKACQRAFKAVGQLKDQKKWELLIKKKTNENKIYHIINGIHRICHNSQSTRDRSYTPSCSLP
tara:strand:+ start:1713 stop:1931 length:219 start_codon:yes stop_codon:yes gene_type:complete